MKIQLNRVLFGWIALAALTAPCLAREADQFTRRPQFQADLRDSAPGFDAWVNEQLDRQALAAPENSDPEIFMEHVAEAFLDPLLPELHSRVEIWATGFSARDAIFLDHPRGRGIYRGTSIRDVKWSWFTGVSNTLRLNETFLGVDKLGHFFSQGWQYRVAARQLEAQGAPPDEIEDHIRELGHEMETGKMGFSTMAMYSPGDLAANWAGWKFWDRILAGPQPYFRRQNGRWVRGSDFRSVEFVGPDWDEVNNPPYAATRALADRIQTMVTKICRRDQRAGIERNEAGTPSSRLETTPEYRVPESRLPEGATRLRLECTPD